MPQPLGYFFVNSIKIKHVKPIWSQFAYESAYDLAYMIELMISLMTGLMI